MLARPHWRNANRAPELVIALVNNMSPAARGATEQRFADLLQAAAATQGHRVRLLAAETLPNGTDSLGALRQARPDGVIVTGAEPQSAAITDEPLWPALAELVDWAADHTISTVWSCLAAHAAVFRIDRISRIPMPRKLTGVFACSTATDHPMLANAPSSWPVPHSRCNTLDAAALRDGGYVVLSHAPRVGPDSFAKQCRASLFLLLQGHLEYGPNSLLGEFRRDLRRFLGGEQERCPDVPEGYFSPDVTEALTRLQERACRTPDLLAAVDAAITEAPGQTWRAAAMNLYSNWLCYLADQKGARDSASVRSAARLGVRRSDQREAAG